MEDRLDSSGLQIRTDELLAFQRDLKEEKELLEKILLKIDDQVHALQVEQLHLLGLINKALNEKECEEDESEYEEDPATKSLDLCVASAMKYFKEEVEEDDEDDNV